MADFPDFKPGDKLAASHMAEIKRRLDRLEGVKSSGRIQVRKGSRGPLQMAYVEGVTSSLGAASGTITAMSGTAFGTGTVVLYWNNEGTAEITGDSVDVLNVGTVISAGKWVWAQQDSFGDWYVAPLECEA